MSGGVFNPSGKHILGIFHQWHVDYHVNCISMYVQMGIMQMTTNVMQLCLT